MNHLNRVAPCSEQLRTIRDKWTARRLKPDNQHGWTGNPPKDLTKRAEEVGILESPGEPQTEESKIFRLANAFVHADWISSTETIGELSPEITDGAAEGAGRRSYIW